MKMFFLILLLNIFIILNFSSPISLLVSILFQTLIICFLTWEIGNSSWPAFILFIIYLGGLMVLFVYIVSLASNEKIFDKLSFSHLLILTLLAFSYTFMEKSNAPDLSFIKTSFFMNFYYMFMTFSLKLTLYSMVHLLISLIVIVKICSKFHGPLKSLN